MPAWIQIMTPDGLQPAPYSAESLSDAAQYEPSDGVYTVTNTFNTFQVLKLSAHLDRMEDSARRAHLPLALDRERLRGALRQMITEAHCGDVRFRITVGRDHPDQCILSIEPYTPPSAAIVAQGVACQTAPDSARHNAAAKTTAWMHERGHVMRAGVYETLLLDSAGAILEGASSNFYAVKGGRLHTAVEGVLPGIAQQLVLEVSPALLPVERYPIHIDDLPRIEEAFITSSSRGVIPVVKIDAQVIGDGVPGSLTLAIRAAYQARMNDYLETL